MNVTTYDPSYCEKVIELGKQGKSRVQMAAILDKDRKTFDNWAKQFPEFAAAFDWSRQLAQAWWEDQGQSGIWSKDFNANAYRLQVLNRFPDDWRDKHDHQVSGGVTVMISSTDEQL